MANKHDRNPCMVSCHRWAWSSCQWAWLLFLSRRGLVSSVVFLQVKQSWCWCRADFSTLSRSLLRAISPQAALSWVTHRQEVCHEVCRSVIFYEWFEEILEKFIHVDECIFNYLNTLILIVILKLKNKKKTDFKGSSKPTGGSITANCGYFLVISCC